MYEVKYTRDGIEDLRFFKTFKEIEEWYNREIKVVQNLRITVKWESQK